MRGKHPKWAEGWDPNPAYEIAERQLEQIDGRLFRVIREGSKPNPISKPEQEDKCRR